MRTQTTSIMQRARGQGLLLLIAIVAGASLAPFIQGDAQATMYLCPGKTGDIIQVQPGPGCKPLVDQKAEADKQTAKPRPDIGVKPDNIETSVSSFLKRYREFMSCCSTDTGMLKEIDDLAYEAGEILKQADELVGQRFSLVASHGALVLPVVEARDKLRALKAKHKQLDQAYEKTESLDYEEAARERRKIQEEEAATQREFRPAPQPSRAPTGKDVGNSRLNETSQTGPALGGTSTLNRDSAVGAAAGNSSLDRAARTGTESVGQSGLNDASQTGPALEDTSSFNRSTQIGPGLKGGSSLNEQSSTGPSVGQSDLNRR
nr:hypothetical protein [Nitrospirota bacterium]